MQTPYFSSSLANSVQVAEADPLSDVLETVYKEARAATLQIEVVNKINMFQTYVRGMGTGFFISPDGLVMTAYHVIEGTEDDIFMAVNEKGERFELELLGFDAYQDLAVLKADVDTIKFGTRTNKDVPYLELIKGPLRVGQDVVTIGNSREEFLASRKGKIRRLNVRASRADLASGTIEFSAKLAPGDSGGPVLNREGLVIGVVSYVSYVPRKCVEPL